MNRNKQRKSFLSLAVCVILGLALASSVFALPVQQENVYVYDEADVLPDETEADINSRARALFALTGARIETVCLKNTGDKTTSEYAIELFSEWKLGSSDKNNGILILLSVEGNDYWTIQGAGLKSSLTDEDLQKINNEYLEPDFAAKKYGDGAKKTFDALLSRLETIYSVDVSSWDPNAPAQASEAPGTENSAEKKDEVSGFSIGTFFRILLIIVLIVAGVIAAVTVFAFIRRPRYVGTGGSKRRHYKTERGAYVSMPPKDNIERVRTRYTSERPQSGTRQAPPQGRQTFAAPGQQGQRRNPQYPQTGRTAMPGNMNTSGRVNVPKYNDQQRTRPSGGTQSRQRPHEHPTVYPEKPPYIGRNNGTGPASGGNGGKR